MSEVFKTARISPCGLYREILTRYWGPGDAMFPFIWLNPSTADANVDDPTIRRGMGFAKREGAAGMVIGNLYSFRATDPKTLIKAQDPYGPNNDETLRLIAVQAVAAGMPICCGWGASNPNGYAVLRALRIFTSVGGAKLVCLGRTKEGHPRHPLYVKADQPFEPYP